MALADLLQAIEADAAAERARADREAAAEATAIVEQARADCNQSGFHCVWLLRWWGTGRARARAQRG